MPLMWARSATVLLSVATLSAVAVACGGSSTTGAVTDEMIASLASPATQEPPAEPVAMSQERARSAEAPVQVEWSSPAATVGCFFFSGPVSAAGERQLGTSARWSRRGSQVALAFADQVVFRGSADAQGVLLTRRSSHDYMGKWQADERIEGSFEGSTFIGRYHYEECDTSGREGCPGRCTIEAGLTIRDLPTTP